MTKQILYISLMIVVLSGLNACSARGERNITEGEKPIPVVLSIPSSGIQAEILATGEIEAVQTANISTRVMGRITNIFVKTGDRVAKGQLLATVWDEIAREETPIPLTDYEKDLLDRRMAEVDEGESWEIVKARLLDRLK